MQGVEQPRDCCRQIALRSQTEVTRLSSYLAPRPSFVSVCSTRLGALVIRSCHHDRRVLHCKLSNTLLRGGNGCLIRQHQPLAGSALPCACGQVLAPHRTRRMGHICSLPLLPLRSSNDAICWTCGNHLRLRECNTPCSQSIERCTVSDDGSFRPRTVLPRASKRPRLDQWALSEG